MQYRDSATSHRQPGARNQQGGEQQSWRHRQMEKRNIFPHINREIIAAAETKDLAVLLQVIERTAPRMNLVNISTALHRLAKIAVAPEARFLLQKSSTVPRLAAAALASLKHRREVGNSQPNTQALSNITWSLATIEVTNLPLFHTVATLSTQHIEAFKSFELSGLLWAFAKLSQMKIAEGMSNYTSPLFTAASRVIPQHVELFTFRCLVMTAWAFSTAQHLDPSLFYGIAPRMASLFHTASAEELVNTAWAFSSAGMREERLFREIAREAISRCEEFRPSEFCSMLCSFAMVDCLEVCFFQGAFPPESVADWVFVPQELVRLLQVLIQIPQRPGTRKAVRSLFAAAPRQQALMRPLDIKALADICRAKGCNLPPLPSWSKLVLACQALAQEDVHGMAEEEEEHPSTGEPLWPSQVAVVADHYGGRVDVDAAHEFQQCLAAAQRQSRGASPATSGDEDEGKKSRAPAEPGQVQWVCTVKNTFLDIENVSGSEAVDVALLPAKLEPLLNIFPPDVCAEKLEAYRLDYQKFRSGLATGAKGEVSDWVSAGEDPVEK